MPTSVSPAATSVPPSAASSRSNRLPDGLASAQGVIVVFGTILIATFALRVVSSLFTEENR